MLIITAITIRIYKRSGSGESIQTKRRKDLAL